MAFVLADRVKETTTTTGTGTVTLLGASAGYQSFSAIGNANSTFYTIAGQSGSEWEVGIGTYTSAGTLLSRDTVLSNSAGTQPTALTFTAGTKDVFVTQPAARTAFAAGAALYGGTGVAATSAAVIVNSKTVGLVSTINTDFNGFSVGPITIVSGGSVTVSSGSVWLVI